MLTQFYAPALEVGGSLIEESHGPFEVHSRRQRNPMCFSAEASFGASGFLALMGVFSLILSRRECLFLAITPIIFAIQQGAEGVIWLAARGGHLETSTAGVAIGLYTFFAVLFWPIWVPFAFSAAEPANSGLRRTLLITLTVMGVLLGLFYLTQGLFQNASAEVVNCSIQYHGPWSWHTAPIYLVCTIFPFFLSSMGNSWMIGLVVVFTAVISFWLYRETFSSVWCFFAAVASFGIIFLIKRPRRV
jgi:hypothetical protein